MKQFVLFSVWQVKRQIASGFRQVVKSGVRCRQPAFQPMPVEALPQPLLCNSHRLQCSPYYELIASDYAHHHLPRCGYLNQLLHYKHKRTWLLHLESRTSLNVNENDCQYGLETKRFPATDLSLLVRFRHRLKQGKGSRTCQPLLEQIATRQVLGYRMSRVWCHG